MSKYKDILTKKFLVKEYSRNKKSMQQIADMLGCSIKPVRDALRKYNIKIRSLVEARKYTKQTNEYSKKLTKKFLIKEYSKKKKTIREIVDMLGCSRTTVIKYLKKHNIKRRTQSESMRGKYKGKNSPCYKGDKALHRKKYYCKELDCINEIHYDTWKRGKGRCHSCSCKFQYKNGDLNNSGKNNPRYGKIAKHGKRKKYNGSYMRSSWEVKYAKHCIKNRIKYRYEPKAFEITYKYKGKKKQGTYRPDFYLSETNTYIEIKGYWRDNAKQKFNAFKKQYKNIKIEVLNKINLQKIGVL